MGDLVSLTEKARKRREEASRLSLPRFESNVADLDFSLNDVTGLATLKEEIRFRDSKGRLWVAPVGLVSDGSSIPRIGWLAFGHPFQPPNHVSGFLHDAAYKFAELADGTRITRADADQMFREAQELHARVGKVEAATKYRMLRAFGWWAWRNHRRRENDGRR